MSKNKGAKNVKKKPASQQPGKTKVLSAYKSEGVSGPAIDLFHPKAKLK